MRRKDTILVITLISFLTVMYLFLRFLRLYSSNITLMNTYKASAKTTGEQTIKSLFTQLMQETQLNLRQNQSHPLSYSTVDMDTELENLNQSGEIRTFLLNK